MFVISREFSFKCRSDGISYIWIITEIRQFSVDTYGHSPGDGSPEPLDLPGQHPPHEPDAVGALVVAGDGDIDELGGRVDIAEGDDGDVSVASLGDGLVISPGVRDNQQTGLAEGGLDLISEGAGGKAASDGAAANVPGDKNTLFNRNGQFQSS